MAGVKETPRQKMIGMMYLVLTAMLALNVSVEVLDAFNLMDTGINQSTTTMRVKNDTDLADFERAALENPEKVTPWKNKADDVHKRTTELYDFIQDIKIKIIKAADGENAPAIKEDGTIDGAAINKKSDTDAGTRIMLGSTGNGEAYTLRKKIEEYKSYLLSILDRTSATALSIQSLLRTDDPSTLADGTNLTWETSQFESTPVASNIALLSLFQLNVFSCESEVLNYLSNQIDAADFKFSNIEVAAIPVSNYVIQGTDYSAEIFLAAYDPSQRPILRMNNGGTFHANAQGKIPFKYTANSVGEQSLRGTIEFIGPEGPVTRPVNLQFQVAEPNVVVSPTKMNVVYRGIENPLSISLSGVSLDKLDPKVTNGTIVRRGNEFFVRPGDGRTCIVSVHVDGKNMGGPTFRVKDLPIPTPALEGISGRTATKGDLEASLGLLAEMKDFDFDLKYKIISFKVSVTIDGYLEEKESNSERLTDDQKSLFRRVRPGQRVAFRDIKAVGPDNQPKDLFEFSIRVK